MNFFFGKKSTYFYWPTTHKTYIVALWMTTMCFFIMLFVIYPRPKVPRVDDFDILIGPLIEGLLMLWMYRVMMQDAAQWNNERYFLMKVMIIFCIHNFPAYELIACCQTEGFNGFPISDQIQYPIGWPSCGRTCTSIREGCIYTTIKH